MVAVVGNMEEAKLGRKPKVVPEDVLAVFDAREDCAEPLVASEIAEEFNCSRKTAYNKLRELADNGTLASKKVGGRSRAYWVPITDADTAPDAPNTGTSIASAGAGGDEDLDVDFPAGRDRSDCEAAIYAARDYLRDHGSASMRELVVQVMPEHPVGYDIPEIEDGDLVADRYRGAWWRAVVKPGLQALPDVEAPVGGGKWRYIGGGE